MRLFIAVALPQEPFLPVLKELEGKLQRGKATGNGNLHLTLAFLGEIGEERVQVLKGIIDDAKGPSFPLLFDRYGFFDRGILFLQPERQIGLFSLEKRMEDNLRLKGFALEDRPYRPHITLARNATLSSPLSPVSIPLMAENVTLFLSHRIDGMLTYTPLYFTPLSP